MHYNEVLEKLICLTNRNITQAELGKVIGLDRSAANKRYKRNSPFSEEEIKKIEEHYGVDLSTLSTSEDYIDIPVRGEVKASMGYGITVYNDEQTATYSISKQLAFDLGVNPRIPPHTIKVVSDNKEKYDPFYIDFSKRLDYDFEVIGEVRWAGRIFK